MDRTNNQYKKLTNDFCIRISNSFFIQIQISNLDNVKNTYLEKDRIELEGTFTGTKDSP